LKKIRESLIFLDGYAETMIPILEEDSRYIETVLANSGELLGTNDKERQVMAFWSRVDEFAVMISKLGVHDDPAVKRHFESLAERRDAKN
jgi:hypothetical protein